MDVHWKNKLIESKAQALGLPLWHYFQYIPCGYLVIKYNMYFYSRTQWSLLKLFDDNYISHGSP